MMTQFSKLNVNQPQTQVNTAQQTQSWCKICGSNGHSADICRSNPEFVNFMNNAQKRNKNYDNACNHNYQSQPNYSWDNNQAQIEQQQSIKNKTQASNIEETLKISFPIKNKWLQV